MSLSHILFVKIDTIMLSLFLLKVLHSSPIFRLLIFLNNEFLSLHSISSVNRNFLLLNLILNVSTISTK